MNIEGSLPHLILIDKFLMVIYCQKTILKIKMMKSNDFWSFQSTKIYKFFLNYQMSIHNSSM
jgi:hypothetical protein